MLPCSTICEGTWGTKWNLKKAKLLLLTPLNAYFMLNKNWTMFRLNSFCNWKKTTFWLNNSIKRIEHNPQSETEHPHSPPRCVHHSASLFVRVEARNNSRAHVGCSWWCGGGGWCCCDRRLPKQPGLGRRGGPLRLSCLLRKCHLKWPSIRQEARLCGAQVWWRKSQLPYRVLKHKQKVWKTLLIFAKNNLFIPPALFRTV